MTLMHHVYVDKDKQESRFNKRTMKRREYVALMRLYRLSWNKQHSPLFALVRISDAVQFHAFQIRDWLRLQSYLRQYPDLLYCAVSEAYAEYIGDRITDIGASNYEAELERRVSEYHFWGSESGS